jgi:uncharacterized protein YegL
MDHVDEETSGVLSGRNRRAPRPMPVVLLADCSGSMAGEKIARLNHSVSTMIAAFAAEDSPRGEIHVAAVAFGGEQARLHLQMTPASQARWTNLETTGRTPMGNAFDVAADLLHNPDVVPDRAFPATLILVSDGIPTDHWEPALRDLLASSRGAKALRLAVGIGTDRMPEAQEVLITFSTPDVKVLRTDQVQDITALFGWVTATVAGTLRGHTGEQAISLSDLR